MKIYCLGDSMTAAYRIAPEHCWVSLLNQQSSHRWINGGISGDTASGMLVRLHSAALPEKPDAVIWLGGTNDILLTGSSEMAKSCAMAFVNHCAAAGVKPVIGIPYLLRSVAAPWDRLCSWQQCRPVLEEYILWLNRFADAAMLRRVDFKDAGAFLQPDGMHPDEDGHRCMAAAALHTFLR